jgi:polyhydroxybutyrate depolymerase
LKGIDGFFSEDEGRWYTRFARGLRGGVFVEIGSWKGRSTSFVGPVCNANGTRLVCVDHWRGSNDMLAERYAATLAIEDVEQTFRANMRALGIEVEVLRESSAEAAVRFAHGTVDRVFLDGSHDGQSVAEDLLLWSDRLKPDGVLAGHDYDDKHGELRAAIDAFTRRRSLAVKRGPRSIWWLAPLAALLLACGGDGNPDTPSAGDASTTTTPTADGGTTTTPSDAGDAATPPESPCKGKTAASGDKTVMLTSNGIARTYRLHVPATVDGTKPVPLVLLWHGYTMSAQLMADATHFTATADTRGFIVALPEGTGSPESFNAGACCGTAVSDGIADVELATDIVTKVEAEYCVDSKRVFTAGFSNGGMMSYRLACELSGTFAAAASVSGTISIDPASCKPSRPVPMLHVHGTSDTVVFYNGGGIGNNESVATSVATLRTADGCPAGDGTNVYLKDDVSCVEWGPCNAGSHVRLCMVTGGGHQWPGGDLLPYGGSPSPNLNTNEAIADFFEKHPMP